MIFLKIIRPDRVIAATNTFVEQKLSAIYTQPPLFSFDQLFNDSNKYTPIIFILTQGVDPYSQLEAYAKSKGTKLVPVSLGQG